MSQKKALERFCTNFTNLLSDNLKKRLTVENDDRASLYSVKDLYENVYLKTGIPIVFDYHHHIFCDGGQTEQEALELALSTWDKKYYSCGSLLGIKGNTQWRVKTNSGSFRFGIWTDLHLWKQHRYND